MSEMSSISSGKAGLVLIRPGASMPAGSLVCSGASSVNEAVLTGEPRPAGNDRG
jgi:cation transport ATPase